MKQHDDYYVRIAILIIASICVGVLMTLFANAKQIRDRQTKPKQEMSEYENGSLETRIA